jgi:parvulin-like peptidyl-prolyl isomerase
MSKLIVVTVSLCLVVGALAAVAFASAWRAPSMLDGEKSSGPILAHVAGRDLRLGEVDHQLRLPNPPAAALLSTPDGRKSYVEGLVRLDLLAHLAEEKGYARDPAFLLRMKQELAATYLEKEFEEPERKRAPTDDELARYFEENKAKLQRPERLRLAVIALRAEDDATRKAKRPLAQQVLAEVKRRSGDYYAFGELAAAKSEEPRSAATSGELPAMSREELENGFGPTLAAKAFAMPRTPGTLLDGVVEGERGLFVVKLLSVEPAYAPKLDDVRDAIRTQLTAERRSTALEAFLADAWKRADVRIDEKALEQLKVSPATAAR